MSLTIKNSFDKKLTFDSLKNRSYKLGEYRTFKIYEPKERIIKCLPYIDRIVQQWYIHEFINHILYLNLLILIVPVLMVKERIMRGKWYVSI